MKKSKCVLTTICALLAISPFYFIQAPPLAENLNPSAGSHQAVYANTRVLETAPATPATVICFFSHGIADTYRQAQKYVHQYEDNGKIHTNLRYTIAVPTRAFNYPDATQRFWRVNFWRTNLGQDADVLTLKRALEQLKKQDPSAEVILYGVSRGASTIINFLAQYHDIVTYCQLSCRQNYPKADGSDSQNHAQALIPCIRAVVLESPFDDIASVARHLAQRAYIDTLPYGDRYGQQAVQSIIGTVFINYNKNGLTPIKSVSLMPKDIPTLIICSEQDQLVPYWSSQALYQALQESGHKHAHLLKLQKGRHAKLLSGPEGTQYQQAVHSFYKKYNLPHNKKLTGN